MPPPSNKKFPIYLQNRNISRYSFTSSLLLSLKSLSLSIYIYLTMDSKQTALKQFPKHLSSITFLLQFQAYLSFLDNIYHLISLFIITISIHSKLTIYTSSSMISSSSTPSFFSKFRSMLSPKKPEKARALHVPTAGQEDLSTSPTPNSNRPSSEFERVFRYFDEDGDGKISPAELRKCMKSTGEELSAEDAEAVVESTDSDGDGLLEYEDFVKLVEVGGEEEKGRNLREAFGVYEMKGQDCITSKSLRRAFARLGETKSIDECKAMIRRFDMDGDGVISFDEFRVMML